MCRLSWNLGASTPGTLRTCPDLSGDYFIVKLQRDKLWRGKVLKKNVKYVTQGSTAGRRRETTCTLHTEHLSFTCLQHSCYLAKKSDLRYRLTFPFLHSPDISLSLLCNWTTDSVVTWDTKELHSPWIPYGLSRDPNWKIILKFITKKQIGRERNGFTCLRTGWKRRALESTVMNFRVFQNAWNFLRSRGTNALCKLLAISGMKPFFSPKRCETQE